MRVKKKKKIESIIKWKQIQFFSKKKKKKKVKKKKNWGIKVNKPTTPKNLNLLAPRV